MTSHQRRSRIGYRRGRDEVIELEHARADQLRAAQLKAEALFRAVETRELIRPGLSESDLNDAIYALAEELFGISTYWHKRIVRAGANTLEPYAANPPNLRISANDIFFLDLGPVFSGWEADFGRTFVTGPDPLRNKLRHDVEEAFGLGKCFFNESPGITARELFEYAQSLAQSYGWEFGGPMAGDLIGNFPHERIAGDKISLYIHPRNDLPMRSLDANGHQRHWILEMHFVDRKRQIGGFFEELLTI